MPPFARGLCPNCPTGIVSYDRGERPVFQELLRAPSLDDLAAYPVSRMVNSADNDGPELTLPLAEAV